MEDVLKLLEARIRDADGPGRDGRTHVIDQGQVADMVLPSGWKPGEKEDNVQGNSNYRDFRPPTEPDARISFFYRGSLTSPEAGAKFHEALKVPAHEVGTKEIGTMKETLRNKANPHDFKVLSAHTTDLNGKRVLIVEGRYSEIQHDVRAIFIDADGTTGRVVQEIFYQAPKEDYLRFLKHAKESMNSIRWKL